MKFGLVLLVVCFFLGTACNSSTDPEIERESLTVTIKNSEIYTYNTGIGGDEEGATISRQANHFEVSDIIRNADTMWQAVYTYKAKSGFSGVDYVELKLSRGSDGASPPTDIEIIKIEFIIN